MFPEAFFYGLVILGLVWTAAGAIALITMLIRDWKNNDLW